MMMIVPPVVAAPAAVPQVLVLTYLIVIPLIEGDTNALFFIYKICYLLVLAHVIYCKKYHIQEMAIAHFSEN